MAYKFLPHTADVKFIASGNSLEKAFTSAFSALKETIAKKTEIKPAEKRQFIIHGTDKENLLYKFLEEFLFLLDSRGFLPSKVEKISIDESSFTLEATIRGDKAANYQITNPVKAVTYNEMFVKKQKNKYVVQVVLDV